MITEHDAIFCANTDCMLHVRPGDAHVRGWGNWAQLAGGILIGRRRVNAIMLCDLCAIKTMRADVPSIAHQASESRAA